MFAVGSATGSILVNGVARTGFGTSSALIELNGRTGADEYIVELSSLRNARRDDPRARHERWERPRRPQGHERRGDGRADALTPFLDPERLAATPPAPSWSRRRASPSRRLDHEHGRHLVADRERRSLPPRRRRPLRGADDQRCRHDRPGRGQRHDPRSARTAERDDRREHRRDARRHRRRADLAGGAGNDAVRFDDTGDIDANTGVLTSIAPDRPRPRARRRRVRGLRDRRPYARFGQRLARRSRAPRSAPSRPCTWARATTPSTSPPMLR